MSLFLLSISGFLLLVAGEGHCTWSKIPVPKAGTMFKCPPVKTIHCSCFGQSILLKFACSSENWGAFKILARGRLKVALV